MNQLAETKKALMEITSHEQDLAQRRGHHGVVGQADGEHSSDVLGIVGSPGGEPTLDRIEGGISIRRTDRWSLAGIWGLRARTGWVTTRQDQRHDQSGHEEVPAKSGCWGASIGWGFVRCRNHDRPQNQGHCIGDIRCTR